MRVVIALSLVVSSLAFADVGPVQTTYCDAPATCTACATFGSEYDAGCAVDAEDAGLERSSCVAGRANNPYKTEFYCPPGTVVRQSCGCSAVEAPLVLGALGLFSVLRRRARR